MAFPLQGVGQSSLPSLPAPLFLITIQAVGSEHTWELLGSIFQEAER